MNDLIISQLEKELKIQVKHINAVLNLLKDGSTVPFIARYRKEMTGNLDEELIRSIQKSYDYQVNLENRKEEVIRLITEKKMLTQELEKEIKGAIKLQQVEDLYLPFKEKKKTKATEAIKFGLEPLAKYMHTFPKVEDLNEKAKEFITQDVKTIEFAIENAGYIIAEEISDNAKFRDYTRKNIYANGILECKVKSKGVELDEKGKYQSYYDFSQPIKKIPTYRTLAFNRGEKEKILAVKISYETEHAVAFINRNLKLDESLEIYSLFQTFVVDALNRLLIPSLEREIRRDLTEKADIKAISVFEKNLDMLIMQAPLKNKIVLGVDPAFRTGCKLAVIDHSGTLIKIDVIYPTMPKNDVIGASKKIMSILAEFSVEQVVVGNGTASRETEDFLKKLFKKENIKTPISIISEAGASVYSASKLAQEEFPELKVEERSAVSIARRIQDPMAELVKIEPKSIGVGQYQHDVNQKKLVENLDFVMLKSINRIGIDVNTASSELLKYVSGLDKSISKNIVNYRIENGPFKSREQLLSVSRLGPKAYEQSAGFLKIINGDSALDETFIHPESYEKALAVAEFSNIDIKDLGTEEVIELCNNIDVDVVAKECGVTENFVHEVYTQFCAPNMDIRDEIIVAQFDSEITKIEDLTVDMKVQGQVRNIIDFGAFVDIGLKNDGLVHISEISNNFVRDVSEVLSIGDVLTFKVLSIDLKRARVQLSLKE